MPPIFLKPLLYCYIVIGSFLPANTTPHPLHVSTSDISYNAKDGQMEVICTLFTDDFEAGLVKQYHTKTDLTKAEMHTAMDVLVKNYILLNLHLKSNNATLPLNYLGFEINKEAVNVYLESPKTSIPKKIDADVSLLHNLFTDQLNIVHMTVGGIRKSAKVDYPEKKVEQEF